ncbi:MAG: protein kinase domain-containing protein [Planctomycetota bacterium]
MSSVRWTRVEQLFHAALDLSPAERAAYLARECEGDVALAQEVEALVVADSDELERLTPPSPDTLQNALSEAVQPLAPGTRVGAYTLLQRVASGGMGTVYLASRVEGGFEQTVAVKVLTRGVASEALLARFQSERALLARLEHPHISRLFDGGATESGLPYIVMEYIDGTPIDAYCRTNALPVDARLALFEQVCGAVQYAHQNLVVHRDIKPANLLVDRRGIPKLLDFGIARVLAPDNVRGSAGMTADGERLMTPEYASPEQVRGEPVSTATDVYSLGVLLYEMLTGARPYRTKTTLPHEIERAIVEQVPSRPSAVARGLSSDLDTVVLTAMQKDPARRYASVAALAEDVRRFRHSLPILARPDALAYRARKFVERHRALVALTGIVVVLLIASAISTVRSAVIARERLAEILRLSDLSRHGDLVLQAESLWPALPERVPAYDAWLRDAHALAGRLAEHQRTLAALRARALPRTDADRERDSATHPDAPQLAELRAQLAALVQQEEQGTATEALLARKPALADEAETLGERVAERRTYRFDTGELRWEHDKLSELVQKLAAFSEAQTGIIADVERRRALASTIVARTIDAHRADWDRAIRAIADASVCPAYGGWKLTPQVGLVPLGRDPASGLWEFAHAASGDVPVRNADGTLAFTESTGVVLVLVPGGRFTMGARKPDAGEPLDTAHVDPHARADEIPLHEIELAPFFVSKYELTQGQWLRFTRKNPSNHPPGENHGGHATDLTHPIEMVSWTECSRVLHELGLTLPTEAQWEYAARAGTTTPFWTGVERDSLIGAVNIADRSATRVGAPWNSEPEWPEFDDTFVIHAPVHALRANPFGLHHVLGNVWEWCRDGYARYATPVQPLDGERPAIDPQRIARGASFLDKFMSARAGHRARADVEIRDKNIGVRPARAIDR